MKESLFADSSGAFSGLIRVYLQERENLYPSKGEVRETFSCIYCFFVAFSSKYVFLLEAHFKVAYSAIPQMGISS